MDDHLAEKHAHVVRAVSIDVRLQLLKALQESYECQVPLRIVSALMHEFIEPHVDEILGVFETEEHVGLFDHISVLRASFALNFRIFFRVYVEPIFIDVFGCVFNSIFILAFFWCAVILGGKREARSRGLNITVEQLVRTVIIMFRKRSIVKSHLSRINHLSSSELYAFVDSDILGRNCRAFLVDVAEVLRLNIVL